MVNYIRWKDMQFRTVSNQLRIAIGSKSRTNNTRRRRTTASLLFSSTRKTKTKTTEAPSHYSGSGRKGKEKFRNFQSATPIRRSRRRRSVWSSSNIRFLKGKNSFRIILDVLHVVLVVLLMTTLLLLGCFSCIRETITWTSSSLASAASTSSSSSYLPFISSCSRRRKRYNYHYNTQTTRSPFYFPELRLYDYDDTEDGDDDELQQEETSSPDWIQAELTLLNAPLQPNPDLTPDEVVRTCCRSLQFVDYPTPNSGLLRCYEFFTYECRKAVTARQGGQTSDRFCQYGLLSPALQPFMGAYRVTVGNVTTTPAQPPLRGALASFPVEIRGAPVLSLQHMSGMNRTGVAETPPVTHMVIRLEQQRRPPNQNCWLVREILDVRHAFAGDMGNVHVGG